MRLACQRCKLACKNPMLRGSGEHSPDIMIVGDVPDKDSFNVGIPFSGKTGQFLRRLVDKLLDDNQTVYYTQAIRCLPPEKHKVTPTEIEACSMWLRGEVEHINPKRLLLLGATATRSLFGKSSSMTKLRGKRLFYKDIPTVSTYHPKYVMGFEHNEQAGPVIRKQWQDDMILAFSDNMEIVESPTVNVVQIDDFISVVRKWSKEDCFVAFDIESTGLDPWALDAEVLCISASNGNENYVTEVGRKNSGRLSAICNALARNQLIAHNSKFDMKYLYVHSGVRMTPALVGDTMLMAYAIDERQELGLKALTTKHFPQLSGYDNEMLQHGAWGETGFKNIPTDVLMRYNAIDSYVTWKLHDLFMGMMDRAQKEYLHGVLLDGTEMLMDVETNGIHIDLKRVERLEKRVVKDIKGVTDKIAQTVPYKKFIQKNEREPNLRSSRDKAELVYTLSKVKCTKFTKGNAPSTEKDELAKIDTPIASALVDLSEKQKVLSTYTGDAARLWVKPDGLVHSTFGFTKLEFGKGVGIQTGRLSSADPNLQNAPNPKKGSPYNVRSYFVSRFPDGEILSADYKAIELRIFALITGARFFSDCFKQKRDPHTEMAAKIFGVNVQDVTPEQREEGKVCNFELLYESSAYGLMITHGKTESYWNKMIREWTKVVKEVVTYRQNIKYDVVNKGYVESYFGARRHFDWDSAKTPKARNEILREAGNQPIQNTASNITVSAGILLNRFLRNDYRSLIVNLVHDNILLDFDVAETSLPEAVRHTMEDLDFPWLKIPIPVDISITPSWGGD
jgi:DNA polymerase-1